MSVFRVEKTKDYTVMSNAHLNEKKMSLKAKGLLSLMLSLPEKWDYSIAGLVAICKENETAIKSTLDELKEFGYLEVIKAMPTKENGGRISYEYIIYERKQEGKKQGIENLGVENQVQLNTNKENTNNKINYNNIVDYLNLKAKTNYRSTTPKTQTLIRARLNDGFTEDDFKKVIDNKCKEWIGTEFERYLTPETLFRPSNFEKYLNQKVITKPIGKDASKREYTKEQFDAMYDNIEDINI
jgi:uncharacterized phage protein (TIGR02220 family)